MIEDVDSHAFMRKYADYVRELLTEKYVLNTLGNFDNAQRLLSQEIERIQNGGKPLSKEDRKFVDVAKDKHIRVSCRVLVPVKDHPKFNFVGKLLGPNGNSLKRLQEDTVTRIAILGRGSMRDKQKEEELRSSRDPRYGHLYEELHVEVSAHAPPAEAHARIALALSEIRRYLVPDYNDGIRLEQMREMRMLSNLKLGSDDPVSPRKSFRSCYGAAGAEPPRTRSQLLEMKSNLLNRIYPQLLRSADQESTKNILSLLDETNKDPQASKRYTATLGSISELSPLVSSESREGGAR